MLIGFAAETADAAQHGTEKARRKQADLVVANDVSRDDSGFGTDTNKVWLCTADGSATELPVMSKRRVAERLLDELAGRLGGSGGGSGGQRA
jgi:phosphopantothenoylcysteine decarboxylase/phosphopantothenate--cysteine ligase